MKYSEAKTGRTFVIRLEDGDILHKSIEAFAIEHHIKRAKLNVLGGADKGSILIVGPENGRSETIVPMEFVLPDVYEITGTGTIFPDSEGHPELHMHISCGRNGIAHTGCVRRGIKVWHVMEIIITELIDNNSTRDTDPITGFRLLQPK